jgi:aminopeptidase YwaD
MKHGFNILIFALLSIQSSQLSAQNDISFEVNMTKERLKKDISMLASDSFSGRESGTHGEELASNYIIQQFKKIGLNAYFGDTSFSETFSSRLYVKAGSRTSLYVNDVCFPKKTSSGGYYPLAYSASGEFSGELIDMNYGIIAPELSYDDYSGKIDISGKIFVLETSIPSALIKVDDYRYLSRKIDTAISHGAVAIIFVNSDQEYPNPTHQLNLPVFKRSIPIIFYTGSKNELFTQDINTVKGQVEIVSSKTITAKNIAAYINNSAKKTVVIGAHYDHLGSFTPDSTEDHVFNGADDNASGSAGVIEIARYIKKHNFSHYNYLFVLFGAEEKGLLGSKHFVNYNSTGNENIAYMINLDMIGRSGNKGKDLIIYGVGTSKKWKKTLKKLNTDLRKTRYYSGSNGGSDHHPFYKNQIPVLFFFTGLHKDYHKVSDHENLINYTGMLQIISLAEDLVFDMEKQNPPKFKKVSKFRNALTYLSFL